MKKVSESAHATTPKVLPPRGKPGRAGRQTVYILSDSTGNLPRHMLTAFLTQFPPEAFALQARPFIQSPEKLTEVLAEVTRTPGVVFHAVVAPEAKARINDTCAAVGLPVCDLTGGFVTFLEKQSGIKASADYRQLHHLDESYHRRIRAMEYTLAHDDGLGLDTLNKAEVVLAGISRTSKTPTSVYLAQQGYRVANVSLAMGVEPPAELLKLPPKRVVGLVIQPDKLADIRTRRNHEWEMGDTAYNDPEMIQEELTWSRRLFSRQGWAILDVTDYAIEETAGRIIEKLELAAASGGGRK
jgi:regulator of PEP synthase PpsR (kinase-PPPase family)